MLAEPTATRPEMAFVMRFLDYCSGRFSVGLGVTGLLFAATTAQAEMVVIATTAPTIQVGTILNYGSELALPPGSAVTLLAADGTSRTVDAPGGVLTAQAQQSDNSSRVIEALSGLVVQKENGSRLGAIRSVDSADCPASASGEALATLTEAGCFQAATEALGQITDALEPSLYVGTARNGEQNYKFGEEITLEVQSNFEAYVYCFHEGSDGLTTRILPLTDRPTPFVSANRPARMPGDLGTAQIAAGTPAGLDKIQCYATDRDIAGEMPLIFGGPPEVGVEALDGPIATMFEKIWTERLAIASVDVSIQPE